MTNICNLRKDSNPDKKKILIFFFLQTRICLLLMSKLKWNTYWVNKFNKERAKKWNICRKRKSVVSGDSTRDQETASFLCISSISMVFLPISRSLLSKQFWKLTRQHYENWQNYYKSWSLEEPCCYMISRHCRCKYILVIIILCMMKISLITVSIIIIMIITRKPCDRWKNLG